MKLFQRPDSSSGYVLTTIFALIGLSMFLVPKQTMIELGTLISPTHSLQDKTLLLFDMLKVAVPLFCVVCVVWTFFAPTFRRQVLLYLSRLSSNSWVLPVILVVAFAVRLAWIMLFPTRPFADSEWYFKTASELAAGYGFVQDLETRRPLASWPIGYPFFL